MYLAISLSLNVSRYLSIPVLFIGLEVEVDPINNTAPTRTRRAHVIAGACQLVMTCGRRHAVVDRVGGHSLSLSLPLSLSLSVSLSISLHVS